MTPHAHYHKGGSMTSVFGTSALILIIGSGTWGVALIAILLFLCCGGMLFGMRGMGKRSDKAGKQTSNKTDDDQRKSA
jgi:uncharacterized membrane protein YhiD involved in acid resistance